MCRGSQPRAMLALAVVLAPAAACAPITQLKQGPRRAAAAPPPPGRRRRARRTSWPTPGTCGSSRRWARGSPRRRSTATPSRTRCRASAVSL
ncbi:hypothetical protein JL720_9000 [Aureococcus anophagefferens]|nr:hypothetical protein JL720_9000 [Aureococcus anophagefferens]